jgi:hypothetical protein
VAFRRPLFGFGLVALAVLSLNFLPNPWAGWPPDPCRAADCFCEAFQNRLVLQPIAAYTNLAYAGVGMLVLGSRPPVEAGLPDNAMRAHPAYPVLYGLMTIAIGAGSFFYHASLTRVGEWFDLMGMYALTSFLVLYNLTRLRTLSGGMFGLLYLVVLAALGIGLIVANALQQVYMAALVMGALILEGLVQVKRRPRVRRRFLLGGLGCFGLGAIFWAGSAPGELCGIFGPIPPHALWHILSAAAVGLLYLYYLSEKRRNGELEN